MKNQRANPTEMNDPTVNCKARKKKFFLTAQNLKLFGK